MSGGSGRPPTLGRGKQPKLSVKQQRELVFMYGTGPPGHAAGATLGYWNSARLRGGRHVGSSAGA